jgi:hypothetical protein
MASLSRALKRIQQDCQQSLPDESILAACRAAGYKWRERKLGPVATIHLFILQVLWFNTAMTHLQHLAAEAVTAAAYCKARMRLPLVVLQQLLRDSSAAMRQEAGDTGLWCSLRVLLVDGSSSITPDTPALQKAFGQPTFVVTLATTLLDPVKYPREKLIDLYGMRWQVETHFAELKTTLKMRKLKSRTPAGTRKELAVYCLVYNLVHAIMLKAAIRQGVTPDRISFVDTIRWLLTTRLSSSKSASPGEELPDLLINPYRPGRHQPRVIKDLQDTYRKMSQPRRQFRGRLDLAKR